MNPALSNGVEITPFSILVRKTLTVLEPAAKVAGPVWEREALRTMLKRRPVAGRFERVMEGTILVGIDDAVEGQVGETGGPSRRDLQAHLQRHFGHAITKWYVPLARLENLWCAVEVGCEEFESQNLELRLRLRVGAEREEIVQISCRHHGGHVGERFKQAIGHLLVHPKVQKLLHNLNAGQGGLVPKLDGAHSVDPVQCLIGLHATLRLAPVDRPGRVRRNRREHFINWNRATAGRVPAEGSVGHHFRMYKSRVRQDGAGDPDLVFSNGIANNLSFDHAEVERNFHDYIVRDVNFAALHEQIMRRIVRDVGLPRELYALAGTTTGRMSCARQNIASESKQWCGLCEGLWGTCSHSGGVDVDDEAMSMICTKAGELTRMTDPYALLKFKDFVYG